MKVVIFDLEATCWNKSEKKQPISEIIEIGAVKLDENLNVIEEFQKFVKPTLNGKLSFFCKNLTKINQKDVNDAETFNFAILDFSKFVSDSDYLFSWGFYDRKQIEKEIFVKGTLKHFNKDIHHLMSLLESKHFSLKHIFGEIFGMSKSPGMSNALKMIGKTLEGTHHRGIDDAKNISTIYKEIYPKIDINNLKKYKHRIGV
jgi:inhibitor of KinA sporulation pathway (predicted exonuclease)